MAHYRILYSYNAQTAYGHTACVGDYDCDAEYEAQAVMSLCGLLAAQYGDKVSGFHITSIIRDGK